MAYLLSIDPGMSTGVALIEYGDDLPATLVKGWQFSAGVEGLSEWFHSSVKQCEPHLFLAGIEFDRSYGDTIICERFTARAQTGFSYTTASLEPLECQGFLKAYGLVPFDMTDPRWRDPRLQYFAGGKDKAEKKKRQHAWLKDHGFYRTGKNLDAPNADDFRSACAHGIAWLRQQKHLPTLKEYFS